MPEAQKELDEINRYLITWVTEIAVNNALTYFDINKVSEGTSAHLLNLLCGWKLEDLNDKQQNFPGIDLGDTESSKLAVQVTSRTDARKIKSTLRSFLNNDYLQTFPNGLRFLLLSNQKRPALSDNALAPYRHFFDPKKDILIVRDLVLQAKKLYYEDKPIFGLVKQFLEREFGQQATQSKNGLISFENTTEKIQFFKQIFAANQDTLTKNFVPVEYSLDGQTYLSDGLDQQEWTNDGLIIYGPSGCGKSALSRQIAVKMIGKVFPVILEAKYYERGLQSLFAKEVHAYGFDSDAEFLAHVVRYNQRVLLILDGLNECKPELCAKFILETKKAANDKHLKLIITTQVPEPALQEFGFLEIYVQRPSTEIREAIATAYSRQSVVKKLTPILTVISTGLEAKMVGEIGSSEFTTNSRFALFAAFVRIKLGEAHIGGFQLMAVVAQFMSDKITFSLTIRAVETLLLNHALPSVIYRQCLQSGILDERSGKVSFSHEMFFNFFVADSIARFAANSDEILSALNAPKNADKKLLIIGAIDDEQLINQVLSGISDSNVFDALLEGEGGEYCQLWANKQLKELLPRISAEISNCEFEFAETPHHFQCVESRLMDWSDHDLGLLFALPGKLANGDLLEQILEMTGKMDDICAQAVTTFWDEAKARGISARSNIFLAAYNGMWQQKLAIGRLFSTIHSGSLGFRDRVEIPVERLQQIINGKQLKSGQIYLLLLLFRWDDRLQLLYPTVLDILQKWRQAPFHLVSEVLQQIGHLYANGEQRDALVSAVTTMHSETLNAWLSTEIFDALGALGELEEDANDYIAVVNAEITKVLNNPDDKNACEAAAGIFFCQYDHPYNSAYYTAIDQLPTVEKKLFLGMALQGGYSSMNTMSLIMRASSILGLSATKHLLKWTATPFIDPTFPVDSLGVFLVVHLLLGRNNCPLPASDLKGSDKKENSIRALAEIYYWYSRTDMKNEQQVQNTTKLAAVLFVPENNYVIETIWQSRHALHQQAYYGELDLRKLQVFEVAFREQIVNACRRALLNLNWQESFWQFERREEMNQHAISLLSKTGSLVDLDVLRPLTEDINYGRYAVEAIKSLGG
jgi:hypothetical protein